MKNIKNLTQEEYDKYLLLTEIPELEEEYGTIHIIILKKNKIHFAQTCEICGDLKLIGKDIPLCKEVISGKVDENSIISYLESLTGLDVIKENDTVECECYEDEVDSEDEFEDDDYDPFDEETDIDLDEDYGDGNYEE